VLVPGTNRMINLLRWDADVDPLQWQRHETVFERAERDGIAVTQVTASRFEVSGLTRSSLRGGAFSGAESLPNRVEGALDALRRATADDARALVYLYYADLDAAGHVAGVHADAWRDQLATVDATVKALIERLPRGTTLYLTADHGMVDVPHHQRIDLAHDAELAAGVRHAGGEPRCPQLYCEPGQVEAVLATWSERLADRAHVITREQAISAGWFGVVAPHVLHRIGEVVVVCRTDLAVVDSRRMRPKLLALIGLHGALTPAESLVPLLTLHGPA
jgi:hypothetical protein